MVYGNVNSVIVWFCDLCRVNPTARSNTPAIPIKQIITFFPKLAKELNFFKITYSIWLMYDKERCSVESSTYMVREEIISENLKTDENIEMGFSEFI